MRNAFPLVGVVCFPSSLSWLILSICFCQRKSSEFASGWYVTLTTATPTWILWPHFLKGLCFAEDILKVPTLSFQIHKGYLKLNKRQEFSSLVLKYVGSQKKKKKKKTCKRETLPTPVFWPREFHGVYTPWGHKESDKIWWLNNNTEASPFVKQR